METIKTALLVGMVWAIFMTGSMELLIPFSEGKPIELESIWIKGLSWFLMGVVLGLFFRGISFYLGKRKINENK